MIRGLLAVLVSQKRDGSWHASAYGHNTPVSETCFAILFLRRATRPLEPVASVDPYSRSGK